MNSEWFFSNVFVYGFSSNEYVFFLLRTTLKNGCIWSCQKLLWWGKTVLWLGRQFGWYVLFHRDIVCSLFWIYFFLKVLHLAKYFDLFLTVFAFISFFVVGRHYLPSLNNGISNDQDQSFQISLDCVRLIFMMK